MSVRILTEGILSTFADLVHSNKHRLYRISIIAPWIGSSDFRRDPVLRVVEAVRGTNCKLLIITRTPIYAWHQRAVDVLRRHTKTSVFRCDSLHTKLYVLECNGFRAAIFGSPNLTPRADEENRELAVEFRTSMQGADDPTAALVSELLTYASYLRNQEDMVPFD